MTSVQLRQTTIEAAITNRVQITPRTQVTQPSSSLSSLPVLPTPSEQSQFALEPPPQDDSRHHEPASITALRDWRDPTREKPLWTVLNKQNGFVLASQFVNWNDFNEKGRDIWRIITEDGDTLWAPDSTAVQQPPSEDFQWSSDEEEYFDTMWGNRVISNEARIDLLATRRLVIINQLRRQEARLQQSSIDPRVLQQSSQHHEDNDGNSQQEEQQQQQQPQVLQGRGQKRRRTPIEAVEPARKSTRKRAATKPFDNST